MLRNKNINDEKDPERIFKLKECCDLLLAGGYFRCRLPTLSPFDKVVGGMVWCLSQCGGDVDVDVTFQENANIGQKIGICDELIRALVRLSSPHPLQSHQIQGLDYDHLFQVLQWLIRKVIETRRLTGDRVRLVSLQQFDVGSYELPADARQLDAAQNIDSLTQIYAKPTRKFKKKQNANFENTFARTEATLLEYGDRVYSAALLAGDEEKEAAAKEKAQQRGQRSSIIAKFESSKSQGDNAPDQEQSRKELEEKEAARLAGLKEQLQASGVGWKVSGANVGSLIGMQSDEIAAQNESYEEMRKRAQEEEEGLGKGSKKSQEQAFQRQVDAFNRKIAAQQDVLSKKQSSVSDLQRELAELDASLEKKRAYIARIERESLKLSEAEEQEGNKEILQRLRSLVAENEKLKSAEAAFKASCVSQRAELLAQLKSLENPDSDENADNELKKMLEIERIYENDLAKLNKIRKVLAKKNQEIARINRQIDDIPTRAELLQYERRFVELYELSAQQLVETRKFYSLYNSLQSSHGYMQREVNLLNSIIEGFKPAMTSVKGRENFIESFEKILDGVDQTKKQSQAEVTAENQKKDAITNKYNGLVEKQRAYFKAVKEFQDECLRNEKLQEAIEQLEGTQEADK